MPGIMPRIVIILEEIRMPVGSDTCVEACSAILSCVVTRVTKIAVASDNNREGICATRPSPMVSSTYIRPASPMLSSC